MSTFFDRFKGRKEPSSAQVAKERLQLVLVTDRSNLSPEKLHELQAEIIAVIKRYIPINEMQVQITIEQRERTHYLVADIPLTRSPDYGAMEYVAPPPEPAPAPAPEALTPAPPAAEAADAAAAAANPEEGLLPDDA